MATQEALQKVDDLKETGAGSLDDKEKGLLNSLTKSDIEGKRKTLESKTFNIDGKKVSLPQIVKDVKISPDRTKSTLYGKPIARQSELGAAIQLYVILHNKSVGKTLIDGKVGKNTNEGIADTQTDAKAGGTPTKSPETAPQSKEKISWGDLANKPFGKYITPESNIKLLEQRGIMNPQTGCLTPTNKSTYINDKKLKFDYKFNGATLKVEVPVNENTFHEIDPKQVADSIIKATINKQNERNIEQKNQSVENGINNFNEKDITDPLIKKWAVSSKIDFTCKTYNNGRVHVYDRNGKGLVDGENKGFMITNTEFLTNGKFDAVKFNAKLKEKCNAVALAEVKAALAKTEKRIKDTPIGKASDADKVAEQSKKLVNEINSCNSDDQLNPERDRAIALKKSAEVKSFCHKELDKMDADISSLNKMSKTLTKENKDKVEEVIRKYSTLTKLSTGKYDRLYKMGLSADYYNKFKKAGMTKDYQDRLRQMRTIASNYEIDIRVS